MVPSELLGRSTSPSFGDLGAFNAMLPDFTAVEPMTEAAAEPDGDVVGAIEAGAVYEAA